METEYGLGWLPDLPDHRDWQLPAAASPPSLPPLVDLRNNPLPIENQDRLSSCTANSSGSMFLYVDRKQGGANNKPSRLQLYYDARAIDGLQGSDRGAYIRSALKALADRGAAPEDLWPYLPERVNVVPPANVYAAASEHQALAYLRVDQSETAMKACLADGFPFVIGSTLYENFFQAGAGGMVQMPSGSTRGGHAYLVLGYRDSDRRFICQNSWSEGWGDKGYFYMPYDYITSEDLSADAWTLRSVEEVAAPEPPKPEPDPASIPVVTKVRYKNDKKLIVAGKNFHSTADLLLDGVETNAVIDSDGRFVLKQKNLHGPHFVSVANPGATSTLYSFDADKLLKEKE